MKINIYIFLLLISISCTKIQSSYLDSERLELIDDLLTKDIKENKIPGAVVLVGNERGVVFQKAYGTKNPITNAKSAPKTPQFACRKINLSILLV